MKEFNILLEVIELKVYEFVSVYCQDLVDAHAAKSKLIDLAEFPHDAIIEDAEGKKIPVVIVNGENIPVSDFFTMDKTDFLYVWKLQSAEEAFDNYMSAMNILEGEAVVSRIRNSLMEERARLAQDVELITEV